MLIRYLFPVAGLLCFSFFSKAVMGSEESAQTFNAKFSEDDLRSRLTPEQYHVTQEKGTERPFTGVYTDNKEEGMYKCVVCGDVLFRSDEKFDSGSGWPSFYDVATKGNVKTNVDVSHGMVRKEVVCASCGAHLGHVFDDGPKETGLRYCINSASLKFDPKASKEKKSEL